MLRDAEKFLHEQIPITRAMGLRVMANADDAFTVEAPVALNSNHLRTAFGGSINSVGNDPTSRLSIFGAMCQRACASSRAISGTPSFWPGPAWAGWAWKASGVFVLKGVNFSLKSCPGIFSCRREVRE